MKLQQLLIKLWQGQAIKLPIFDLWPLSVTLTFDIGPWVLYTTRLLMTLNNLTKFYEDTTITYQVMARTSQKMPIFDLWPLSVTLTFDIGPWVLYATRLHMTLNNLTKFYEATTITYQVMARTSQKMPIFYLWPLSVTLTFDIGPWVLYATRLLMTLNNLTKFYEDTTITYQVMARTSQKMPIFDLWPLSVTLTFDIGPWVLYATRLLMTTEQFDKVLWRYNNNLSSYGPDKPENAHFWPLTSKCDLDLWHRAMGLIRDTPTIWHWTIWQSFMKIQQ